MKSIANQYRDLKEGKMSQQNFMRNLRMTMPQYVTNVTSFGDAIKILRNKSILSEAWDSPYDGGADDLAAMGKGEFRGFNYRAIEAAADDKISHTEEDDNGDPIYWSTKNPYVNYYIGSNDQIIKYDGKTGERYPIGDLGDYDQNKPDEFPFDYDDFPSKDDYDADYEEPREDFDMAEGEGDEDAMYDAMIKKIEDELAAMQAANAQYDEALNEAVGNFELKKLARELYSVVKRVNGVTSVKIVTSDIKNAASAFQAASKKGNTYAEDAVMAEIFVNEAASFLSVILSGSARFLNPVANEVNKQLQAFVGKNYPDQLDAQYTKAPNDNTMLGINIKFKTNPAGVKESEELNEAKKPNVEKAEDENLEEVTLGIFMEHACFPDKSYEEIEKIVKKNIKKNPNYYTNYKLTGIRDYELETMDSSKPEDHQMKFYTEKTAVDTARGMQKVKMPKKEEKKKLKENKIRTDIKGQIVQATNNDGVTFSKNDEARAIDNGEKIKITGFKEEQGKVKALFDKGMFFSAIDIDGLEKVVSASPIAQALTKEEIEELMREVMNEYYDGRDNLIDPIAAEENN